MENFEIRKFQTIPILYTYCFEKNFLSRWPAICKQTRECFVRVTFFPPENNKIGIKKALV